MTIDEAIDYVEDINTTVSWNKDQVQDADFFLKVAEWLEGYKKFLEFQKNCTFDNKVYCYGFDEGYEKGRADEREEHEAMCESCVHKVSVDDIKAIEDKARADEREELLEDIIQELDILNHQGGGIGDLLFYINRLKGQKQ